MTLSLVRDLRIDSKDTLDVTTSLSLESLILTHYKWAIAYATLVSADHSQAEDLVHDAIMIALRNPPRSLDPTSFKAWLRTVITRRHLRLRKRSVRERLQADPVDPRVHIDEPAHRTIQALDSLSPRQRACVILRYLEDLTEPDIARTLRISTGSVKKHLARARSTLQREIRRTDLDQR